MRWGMLRVLEGMGGVSEPASVCTSPPAMAHPVFTILLLGAVSLLVIPSDAARRPCPYCDSSVFEYCSDKLLHDACCCLDPYEHQLPAECKLADCSFLHANTCRDHHLITKCCCNRIIKI